MSTYSRQPFTQPESGMSTYPHCPHLLECALTHGDELLVEVEGCGTVLLNGSHIPVQQATQKSRRGQHGMTGPGLDSGIGFASGHGFE